MLFSLWLVVSLPCIVSAKAQGSAAASRTQGRDQSASGSGYVLHQSVQEVILYCAVLDAQGHLVTDLNKEHFSVREGKVAVPIASFRHQDDPISLALVVDSSGSMTLKRQAVDAAALALVQASNPADEAFVLNFTEQQFLDQDFTSDLGKLRAGLAQGKGPGGQTALYDTLIYAADHLVKDGHSPKQAIVVVTDGEDNASTATLEQAIRRVQQTNGPVVYAIGLLYDTGGGAARQARGALKALAEETGGIAFFPRSLEEVGPIAEEVAKDIRNQYRLTFHPLLTGSAGPYHPISVEARKEGRGKLRVRTRKGYLVTSAPAPGVGKP